MIVLQAWTVMSHGTLFIYLKMILISEVSLPTSALVSAIQTSRNLLHATSHGPLTREKLHLCETLLCTTRKMMFLRLWWISIKSSIFYVWQPMFFFFFCRQPTPALLWIYSTRNWWAHSVWTGNSTRAGWPEPVQKIVLAISTLAV